MDNIDTSLNKLMQQMESMDGKIDMEHSLGSGNSKSEFVVLCRKYFLYWATFIFCVIFIIIIRPAAVFYQDPTTNRVRFVWSAFFMHIIIMYAFIMMIIWGHNICKGGRTSL